MTTWMQGFCLGAALITVLYLALSIWAALSLNVNLPRPPTNEDQPRTLPNLDTSDYKRDA